MVSRAARWPLGLLLAIAAGCGEEAPPPEVSSEASTPADAPAATTQAAQATPRRAQPPLPAAMQRERGMITFPHDPHVAVDCGSCHGSVPGHVVHDEVACRDCHVASTPAPPPPARAVCLSCHHGEGQMRACEDCHETVGPLVAERMIRMSVWTDPRPRDLPFAHARHEPVTECTTCHQSRPALEASLECASCHQRHHRPEASCMTCHASPREGVHALEAHLGCGGAGCHADPVVEALPPSRPSCLVCHQDQVDHNPGRDCADCHQVRAPSEAARPPPAGWSHTPWAHP